MWCFREVQTILSRNLLCRESMTPLWDCLIYSDELHVIEWVSFSLQKDGTFSHSARALHFVVSINAVKITIKQQQPVFPQHPISKNVVGKNFAQKWAMLFHNSPVGRYHVGRGWYRRWVVGSLCSVLYLSLHVYQAVWYAQTWWNIYSQYFWLQCKLWTE